MASILFTGRAALRAVFAAAAVLAAVSFSAPPASASPFMQTGGLTSQPIGHYDFCKANPVECNIRLRDEGPEVLTPALWDMMVAVNLRINAEVKPMNDIDIYGKEEVWTYPVNGVGDCEDYVLEKRREMMNQGVSLTNLLITVLRRSTGEGHAVLTVRTDKGDYLLDNLVDKVMRWDETDYTFLKRQASNHTGRWVSIRDGQPSAPLVGSVSK